MLNGKAAASSRLDPNAIADSRNLQGNDQNDSPQSDQDISTGTATPISPQRLSPRVNSNVAPMLSGGPVVGVASISKQKTIREFDKKDHYNQWQFVYDPTTDNRSLITTPIQPLLKTAVRTNPLPDGQGSQQPLGVNVGQVNPPIGPASQAPNQR